MITRLKNCLSRFCKDDDGSAIVFEFVIMVPLVFSTFFMAMELGIYSIRQMYLDRGLEVSTREVRLNTSVNFTHDYLKAKICQNAGNLPNCMTELRLELIPIDPRNFAGLPASADCVDTSTAITPVRGFTLGEQHDVMLVRACYKFSPVFPTTGLGYALAKDGSGRVAMTSISAFVQEPS